MAHSCPECSQACYCGGDIDDAFDVDQDAEANCAHCLGREDDDDWDQYGVDDDAGIEPTYLCCGRMIEDGHADSCHERIEDDWLERQK